MTNSAKCERCGTRGATRHGGHPAYPSTYLLCENCGWQTMIDDGTSWKPRAGVVTVRDRETSTRTRALKQLEA